MARPKALLQLGPRTFLQTILETAADAGLEPRVVVLGAEPDKILSHHDLNDVIAVLSEDVAAGPIGSIRAGIRVLFNQEVEAAVIWHVDRPLVKAGTIEALVSVFRDRKAKIVLPEFDGRRGHPVLFARQVFPELLQASDSGGARDVVRADPARVAAVPVPDPAVLEDINTPEAYRRLLDQYPGGQ